MIIDDAISYGQAETGSFPGFLGSEERFINLREYFRRHAFAGVCDADKAVGIEFRFAAVGEKAGRSG